MDEVSSGWPRVYSSNMGVSIAWGIFKGAVVTGSMILQFCFPGLELMFLVSF